MHPAPDSPDPQPSASRRMPASSVLPAPRFRYSPVVVAGGFAFVSGMVGLDAATGRLADGGVYGETRQILFCAVSRAEVGHEQGWSLEQLVVARIYCADFARFADVNRAWEERFADVAPPARTSLGATGLPLGALVEMEFQLVVR